MGAADYLEKAKSCVAAMRANPAFAMQVASTVSGLLLVLGGITGILNIFNLFNPLEMVLSFYNILFGLLILATELKSWPIIKTFQKRVDVYFHLLSIPRGKGGFYCFIGVLAFFASDWSLSRICVLVVALVGVLHVASCAPAPTETEGSKLSSTQHTNAGMMPASEGSAGTFSGALSSFAAEVVSDNPEVLSSGMSMAARAGTATAPSV